MDQVEERLIEVRRYEHLYNSSSKNYKDSQMANNSWREISNNTGVAVVDCMKRWKNLRDKYFRLRKKHSRRSGDPGGQKVPAFYHFLSWLAPHVKHRETESNFDSKTSSAESTPSSWAERMPSSSAGSTPSSSAGSTPSSSAASSSAPSPAEPPRSATPELPSTPQPVICPPASVPIESPVSRKRKRDQDHNWILKRVENIDERRLEVQQRLLQGGDEYSRFGQTVADMIKRLPEDRRSDVMCEVYIHTREKNLIHTREKN
ncbi:transcription factor Adf-1-like [Scomber scombrus]|uniref:transcription factor Adf-1-like n=1 Tax=Scomber scombrus TaxID=13677 RepID=UPI002DDB7CCC|nr:transcription factor Adf-1-like [Scomber scombrus]